MSNQLRVRLVNVGRYASWVVGHFVAGFALAIHFLSHGDFWHYVAVELFGVGVALLTFLGLVHMNASPSSIDVSTLETDNTLTAITSLYDSLSNDDVRYRFLSSLENSLLTSDHTTLSPEEMSELQQWFAVETHRLSAYEDNISLGVDMEHSVLDDNFATIALSFPAENQETYSPSSYQHVLQQWGVTP